MNFRRFKMHRWHKALFLSALCATVLSAAPGHAQFADRTVLPEGLVRPEQATPLPPGDAIAIHEVVTRVYLAEDRRDFEALRQLVTEDLLHAHSVFGTVEGADAFVEFVRSNPDGFDRIRHQAMNIVTRALPSGEAEALSYILVINVHPADGESGEGLPRIIGHGVVRDRLVQIDGRWRIAERIYDQMAVSAAFVPDRADRERFARPISEAVNNAAEGN